MKTLLIMRHAKSNWDDASLADFDRPLNDRGLRTAPFMGELMTSRDIRPDLVIGSPAKRAMQTALLVKDSAGLNCPIQFNERIYEASPLTLHGVVSELSDEYSSVLLVGHNPGMEGFIRYLTGRIEPMPTAALAVIELDAESWSDLTGETGRLTAIYRPKDEMKVSEIAL
ncbi:MAG: histidine phosphatase family protein [Acidobacteria bacterium]|nr:histidine phosphatase family protein [Acidobacteriota bacterium]